MSIALIIEELEGKLVNEYIPISTQANFSEIWMKIIEKHNFEWIPLFETGGYFTQEDLPYILEELFKFMDMSKTESLEVQERIIPRLTLLISSLEKLKGKNSKYMIG